MYIPIIRYADVLLIFAEAENEANGPTAAAYDAVNQLRVRAGLDNLSGLSKRDFPSGNPKRMDVRDDTRTDLSFQFGSLGALI